MKSSLKIRHIESKISELQAKQQDLLEQRQKDIAALIARLSLATLDGRILLGGLAYLKEKILAQDSIIEEWHNAGERFLRRKTKSKKLNTSKKAVLPSSTHQLSQKLPQSREKQNEKTGTI